NRKSKPTSRCAAGPLRAKLDFHRQLRPGRNRRQPVIAVRLLTANNPIKLRLQRLGHGAELALAHGDLVDGTNGRDFGGSAGEKNFVGDVQRLAWYLLLHDLDAEVARDLQHRVARDAWKHGVAQRRSLQYAVADDKQILAR